MKYNFKKGVYLVLTSAIIFSLTACGGFNQEKISETAKKEEIITEVGIYVGKFGKEYIDVQLTDKKKMYLIPDKLKPKLDKIKVNDTISIQYTIEKGSDIVVKSIEKSDQAIKTETAETTETRVEKKEKNEDSTEIDVYINGNNEKQKAVEIDSKDGYMVYLLEGFDFHDGTIVSKTFEDSSVFIEKLNFDAEIKPLRWKAAAELKKIGDLRELRESQIYHPEFRNSEFVFASKNNSTVKTIVVKRYDKDLMRFTITSPENNDEVTGKLWSMIKAIK